jgi:hypothetical protein
MFVYVPDQKHIVIQYSVHPVYSLRNAYPTYSYRNALNDLLFNGDATGTPPARFPRPVSRSLPPRIFGVLAQNAQIYTLG